MDKLRTATKDITMQEALCYILAFSTIIGFFAAPDFRILFEYAIAKNFVVKIFKFLITDVPYAVWALLEFGISIYFFLFLKKCIPSPSQSLNYAFFSVVGLTALGEIFDLIGEESNSEVFSTLEIIAEFVLSILLIRGYKGQIKAMGVILLVRIALVFLLALIIEGIFESDSFYYSLPTYTYILVMAIGGLAALPWYFMNKMLKENIEKGDVDTSENDTTSSVVKTEPKIESAPESQTPEVVNTFEASESTDVQDDFYGMYDESQQRRVSFLEAIKSALIDNYCNFRGRASRSEFWWFQLFAIVAFLIILFIIAPLIAYSTTTSLSSVLILASFIALSVPRCALSVRRLHDTDRSAWYLGVVFFPFIGDLILLKYLCESSDMADNDYGSVPNIDNLESANTYPSTPQTKIHPTPAASSQATKSTVIAPEPQAKLLSKLQSKLQSIKRMLTPNLRPTLPDQKKGLIAVIIFAVIGIATLVIGLFVYFSDSDSDVDSNSEHEIYEHISSADEEEIDDFSKVIESSLYWLPLGFNEAFNIDRVTMASNKAIEKVLEERDISLNRSILLSGQIDRKHPIKMEIEIEPNGNVSGRYAYETTLRNYGDKPSSWFRIEGNVVFRDGNNYYPYLALVAYHPDNNEPYEYFLLEIDRNKQIDGKIINKSHLYDSHPETHTLSVN